MRVLRHHPAMVFLIIISIGLISCSGSGTSKPAYYTLEVNGENGSVSVSPEQEKYREGTEVTLTATPDSGYDFFSWTGDNTSCENSYTFKMDGNKNITANFTVYFTDTYYVDYENGDDGNTGLSATAAWKHAPGDVNAAGNPAAINLQPGSTVLFKGGIVYKGSIVVPASGSQNHHIKYQGDAWPGLENVKAVIDGGDSVTGWTPCASAMDCAGNPNYSQIYYAYIPTDVDPLSVNLHEYNSVTLEDEFLWPSQDPNPPDPYFFDELVSFRTVTNANISRTTITDAAYFTQTDPSYWADSYMLIWRNPNRVVTRRILSFNPSAHRVSFEDLGAEAIYPDHRNQYFSVFNSPHAIDRAGEYFVSTTPDSQNRLKILLWPKNPAGLNGRITYSVRKFGINLNSRSNITIEGFKVIKHSGSGLFDGIGIGDVTAGYMGNYNIVIKNNLVTHNRLGGDRGNGGILLQNAYDSVVEGNTVIDNPKHRGIFISTGKRIKVKGNTIVRSGSTSLTVYTVDHGIIDGNTIRESKGSHANGITIYIASNNILVANNTVKDSDSPITLQDSGNVWFINNFVDAGGRDAAVNEWGLTNRGPWNYGTIAFFHNTFVRCDVNNSALNFGGKSASNTYIALNNIIDGGAGDPSVYRRNNLYTGLSWSQNAGYGWYFADGESLEEDLSAVFTDYSSGNFTLRTGPAVNSGADISAYLPVDIFPDFDFSRDITGKTRTGIDLGAYDY